MKPKKILSVFLSFQLAFTPFAKAEDGPSFDFSDEPEYVNSGEDDRGSGGDRSDRGEGGERDDRDRHDSRGGDQSNENDGHSVDRTHDQKGTPQRVKIHTQDFNRGFGFLVVDTKNREYYRGDNGRSYEWDGDIIEGDGTDNTDIYISKEGINYVKSTDGQYLLALDGLRACTNHGTCASRGYKEDWWNYSLTPNIPDPDEEFNWYGIIEFSKLQLKISKGIAQAQADPAVNKDANKMQVLREAKALLADAITATGGERYDEAQALQEGSAQLVATVVDIGLSISPLGWAKDAYELITGQSFVDGHTLTDTERLIAGIGVMMPGVSGFAFAGMKIVSRNPIVRKGASEVAQYTQDLLNVLGNLKPERLKVGENLGTVAIIGRDMNYVREAGARLNAAGINTRTFEMSNSAAKAMSDATR